MIKPELSAIPRLGPGIRLNEKNQQPRMLLMPGKELRLSGPSLEIVLLCDGKHTVQEIGERLVELYAKAEPERVTQDLLNYLALLHGQKAIEY
ncbi:MAG: PqqD family peptide modification chaperone [Candidatus Acidiferrum sp.]